MMMEGKKIFEGEAHGYLLLKEKLKSNVDS